MGSLAAASLPLCAIGARVVALAFGMACLRAISDPELRPGRIVLLGSWCAGALDIFSEVLTVALWSEQPRGLQCGDLPMKASLLLFAALLFSVLVALSCVTVQQLMALQEGALDLDHQTHPLWVLLGQGLEPGSAVDLRSPGAIAATDVHLWLARVALSSQVQGSPAHAFLVMPTLAPFAARLFNSRLQKRVFILLMRCSGQIGWLLLSVRMGWEGAPGASRASAPVAGRTAPRVGKQLALLAAASLTCTALTYGMLEPEMSDLTLSERKEHVRRREGAHALALMRKDFLLEGIRKERETMDRLERDFFHAKRDARLWIQELTQRRGADLELALKRDGTESPGPLSPYLIWNSTDRAFVCNVTNLARSVTRRGRYPEDARPALRFLAALESLRLPAVLTDGSLLGFVRDCKLGTDDVDFVTFARFMNGTGAAGSNAHFLNGTGFPGRGCCIGEEIKLFSSFGRPGHSGFELAYNVFDNGLSSPYTIDLSVAHEEEDTYEVAISIQNRLYSCSKPRPPTFFPAKHPSGARFFIPATAVTELDLLYGPRWWRPYPDEYGEQWRWSESPRHFLACNFSAPMQPSKPTARQSSWDRPLEPLSSWREMLSVTASAGAQCGC